MSSLPKEKVLDIIPDPSNKFSWTLYLNCGHDAVIYSRRPPTRRFHLCSICHPYIGVSHES